MKLATGWFQVKTRSIADSSYVRDVAKLASGQMVAAMLPLLAAPVLGRLYLPEDYGLLAAFMAVSTLLTTISTLQLHHGVIAESSEQRAEQLVHICTVLGLAFGVIALLTAIALYILMSDHPSYSASLGWLTLLPVTTFLGAVTIAVSTLANRRNRYDALARIPVLGVLVSVPLSIILGFAGWGVDGLFVAYALSLVPSAIVYIRLYRELVSEPMEANWPTLWQTALRHRRFTIYTLPSEFLSTLNLSFPVYALSGLGAAQLLGNYSRILRLVGAPLNLMGSSISMVFRQRASLDYRQKGSCRQIMKRTALSLIMLGAVPTLIVMFIGPDLFVLFLGPNWVEAGKLAQVLAPMLLIRMVTSPLSAVFRFTGRQAISLWIQIFASMLLLSSFAFCLQLGAEPIWLVWGYALAYSLVYLVSSILAWRFATQ